MPPELIIDPEFAALCPPLSEQERALLEASIRAEGCRDALVVWGGILVDGHNRYAICERLGVGYRTVARDFGDRSEALAWIVRNQLGRRNLTDFQRIELAERLRPHLEAQARRNLATSTGGAAARPSQNFAKAGPIHTREEIARAAGVSRETVRKAEVILRDAPEPVQESLRRGEMSIDAAYRQVRPPKPTPEPTPEPEPGDDGHANGQSRLNGQLVADPPDIAAARAAGRIAPDVVPEITEASREPGEDDDLGEPDAEPVEMSDDEWLAALPLDGLLDGPPRRCFRRDALVYRRLEAARKTYQHHFRRVTKELERQNRGVLAGEYEGRTSYWLRSDHPKHWKRCADLEHGGCGGSGSIGMVGTCPACKGRGYRVYVS